MLDSTQKKTPHARVGVFCAATAQIARVAVVSWLWGVLVGYSSRNPNLSAGASVKSCSTPR